MRSLRFEIFGAGFWSQYQLAAWQELKGAACVAIQTFVLGRRSAEA